MSEFVIYSTSNKKFKRVCAQVVEQSESSHKTFCCMFEVVYVAPSYGQQLGVMQHQNHEMLFYIISNALLMQNANSSRVMNSSLR